MSDFSDGLHPPEIDALHPRALAYLGDAVYELFVREFAIQQCPDDTNQLHRYVTDRVRADFQVKLLHDLDAAQFFTDDEKEMIRRGRNVSIPAGRRSSQAVHRQATGFEAVIGYWKRHDDARLAAFFAAILPALSEDLKKPSP